MHAEAGFRPILSKLCNSPSVTECVDAVTVGATR
jgi:hypothetical protein